jgi:hypothetical protein
MRYSNTIYIRFAFATIMLFAILVISVILIIKLTDNAFANSFLVNLISSFYAFLLFAAVSFAILLFSDIRDHWKIYRLFQTTVNKPIIIYSSNIILPPGTAFSYNMRPLMFGGWVISWQEYIAASQLSSFLKQDPLAGYLTSLKNVITIIFPEARPLEFEFQISPMDEDGLRKTTYEAKAVISLGSPGSNFTTAYVLKYYSSWLKFGIDGRSIEVARGTSGEVYSLDKYADLGIIQRVKLQNMNITVIVLAGLTDLSTRMCATYLVNHWKEIEARYSASDDFGLCLAVSSKDTEAYNHPIEICAYP